ncbi:HD domain-containing protein [Candidatus Nomurabacteria bacterium]|nr:HD domain-containing protein [Candidatus Kaiserbacteria bacterium]MCB9814157.1 HD domain-containing protein [Candidatus Nomurabacteria bacterium]
MNTKELVQDFLKLQNAYSFTKRALVTADRYSQIALKGLVDKNDYDNEILREPLMEHIGHLPILASYFHPHIEHSSEVNLGRAMVMLSIHDIGETITGEIFAYHKTEQDNVDEYEAAIRVLHPNFHSYLEEYEANETMDAKYAKSMDVLAPNIHEVDMPQITMKRFSQLNATYQKVIDKKRKYMEWDLVMLEVFDLLMSQYQNIENGSEPVFEPEPYDVV